MTTENGLPKTGDVRKHIEKLVNRRDYLREKLDDIQAYKKSVGIEWHKEGTLAYQELKALEWALPILEAEFDSVARMQRNVMRIDGRLGRAPEGQDVLTRKEIPWEVEEKACASERVTAE